MPTLDVPGAQLYYDVWGVDRPLLLLIPGGNGDTAPFAAVAGRLAASHTVVSYDRRGFSRSPLDEPPNDDKRVTRDVEDAVRLIEHFGGGSAAVLGSSSGAIVALELLSRRPDCVRTVVAHEPPLFTLLPDGDSLLDTLDTVRETYRRDGLRPAMARFGEAMGFGGDEPPSDAELPPSAREVMDRVFINMHFWMEHELSVYPRLVPDTDALHEQAGKLVLAGSEEGRAQNQPPYRPNTVLAARFGLAVADFPGGHVGYHTHPDAFADRLRELLAN